jgi:hypothetical protein
VHFKNQLHRITILSLCLRLGRICCLFPFCTAEIITVNILCLLTESRQFRVDLQPGNEVAIKAAR